PALDYDASVTIYTYGKTLLAPGQRIGYAALHPSYPDREAVAYRIFVQQLAAGWGFPNALLQHAIGDLEALSIDVGALQARRDRMVPALREMGYEVTNPEGTFYLMVRSPDPDDRAFCTRLAEAGALVLPGTIVETPGWFRVSLTASDEMVEKGLEVFRRARVSPS
ncbi:MAG TPA: aminotransferase class I/II-fold pyridoxal phosphate-dependent enzyme, partial [Candidatus Limnocylindrales bacterium]|nr:aminotransferase class I/II-fold pyridoxal phosphate-dependent enzyme [Candidatus Limnocylindrales bacterium]